MNKIYTVKGYEEAIETREQIQEQVAEEKESNEAMTVPEDIRPLKREMAEVEAAIAAFAIRSGKPAVSKGKPEYSWKRSLRNRVSLCKR